MHNFATDLSLHHPVQLLLSYATAGLVVSMGASSVNWQMHCPVYMYLHSVTVIMSSDEK